MYPSDYGYATGGGSTYNRAGCLVYQLYGWSGKSYKTDCAEESWLYNSSVNQWTITPVTPSDRAYYTSNVSKVGRASGTYASKANTIRPVVYLKSNVYIKDGNGTQGSPYIFDILE